LAEAVDATRLTWTTGGALPWVGQTNMTYDGVDAAESGPITDNLDSWLQTTVVGPGTLTFWWKVSSESSHDFLEFYINGVLQSGRISDYVDWQHQTFELSDGSQTLRWRYTKDFIASSGQDRGWVDMVTFRPTSGPAIIVTQPQNQTATEGASVTFDVVAGGEPLLFYQWFKNTTALTYATNSSYGIQTVQTNDAGSYSVVVSNALDTATSSNAVLTVFELAEVVDAPELTWTTGGTLPWIGQANMTHDGVDAAQSGHITHSQESWLQTDVVGPGTLTFWWKVSSETNYDFLEFYMNDVLQSGSISGEVDWQQQTNSIPAGLNTVKWRYMKDYSASAGQDTGWVDEVNYVGSIPLQFTSVGEGLSVSNGSFNVQLTASPGATAVVDRSFDLTSWTPWQTSAVPVGGLDLLLPIGTNQQQFLRARIPQP
jgi:Immunoglobulin domain